MKKILKFIVASLSLSLMIVTVVYASAFTNAVDDSYTVEENVITQLLVRNNDTCTNTSGSTPNYNANCFVDLDSTNPAGNLSVVNNLSFTYVWNQGGTPGDQVTFDYELTNQYIIPAAETDIGTVTITLDGEDAVPEFSTYVYIFTLMILFFLIFSFVAGPNKKYLNN